MRAILLMVLVCFSLGSAAWSQDEDAASAPAEPAEPAEPADTPNDDPPADEPPDSPAEAESGAGPDAESGDSAGPAVDLDENPELDQQTYEKDDDEFIPSEEIPVDQSIPFPTDI